MAAALGAARPRPARRARTLRFVPQADLTVLDPVFTTAYITRHHALMVYDQLYGMDAKLRPQPQMVEGHTVADDGLPGASACARACSSMTASRCAGATASPPSSAGRSGTRSARR